MLNASSDLIDLARSQIVLLTQVMGAGSSVMYITEAVSGKERPNLIEIASYPDEESGGTHSEGNRLQASTLFLPAAESGGLVKQGRVVLPLIYRDTIMGFLMTGREDRDWTEQEEQQIQQVANTLAIACALDRRTQWLEENQSRIYVRQKDFLSTLFHQLRNPLTALRTFAQLLLRRILPENSNYKIVAGILRETKHIQELLAEADQAAPSNLLAPAPEIALLPAADLELAATDLSTILEPLMVSAGAIAQEQKISFHAYIPENIPLVMANASALREVLSNLVDNAIKYTPTLGEVTIGVQTETDYVTVTVQDTGLGIPEADMARLFERNFRGRQAEGDISGTGLGLAITRDFIEKMQGEIHVYSEVGLGSTFSVRLNRAS